MIAAASALLLAATLGACGRAAEPQSEQAAGNAAEPDAKPGLVASKGRLVLPAVPGNPGAAYFDLANGNDRPAALAGVHVDGSRNAQIHDMSGGTMNPVAGMVLAPGETVSFEPGGKHVMVFGLSDATRPGSSAEMTLTFADGDKLSTPLKVETVTGDDTAGNGH